MLFIIISQKKAKEKAESKRLEYTSLNSELIHDIQAIIADRSRFFDALFANVSKLIIRIEYNSHINPIPF